MGNDRTRRILQDLTIKLQEGTDWATEVQEKFVSLWERDKG